MEAKKAKHFDIIIAGSGISGYSLLFEAMQQGIWQRKQILVVDRSFKDRPNKMISFWADKSTPFRRYSAANWGKLAFYSNAGRKTALDTGDYEYFSIKSGELLDSYHQHLLTFSNIHFLEAEIHSCLSDGSSCEVQTSQGTFTATYVFNSLFTKPEIPEKYQYFLQHFKGVDIVLKEPLLHPEEAVIMDYRTDQQHGTTFFYCLPLAANRLFVEYTLFSKSLLPDELYDEAIRKYLSEILQLEHYVIEDEEQGVIPMTDYPFTRRNGNILYLGTAGGDTRGSTGYTFMNVQQTIQSIIAAFRQQGTPFYSVEHISPKDLLYDATLLKVLNEGSYKGHEVFSDLFQGTAAKNIFRFLDSDSSLWNDIKIMLSLRKWPFMKHFVKTLLGQ